MSKAKNYAVIAREFLGVVAAVTSDKAKADAARETVATSALERIAKLGRTHKLSAADFTDEAKKQWPESFTSDKARYSELKLFGGHWEDTLAAIDLAPKVRSAWPSTLGEKPRLIHVAERAVRMAHGKGGSGKLPGVTKIVDGYKADAAAKAERRADPVRMMLLAALACNAASLTVPTAIVAVLNAAASECGDAAVAKRYRAAFDKASVPAKPAKAAKPTAPAQAKGGETIAPLDLQALIAEAVTTAMPAAMAAFATKRK